MERVKSIDKILEKYANCSASDLVAITHSTNSPWRMKDATKPYQIIDDEIIKQHHIYEEQYFEKQIEYS